MEVVNRFIDTETEPDWMAENIEILYSDSARLQMKMVTPLVKQFNSVQEMRDEYPQGLRAWFYEDTGELKGEITAKWAKHDRVKDLWEAQNDVVITKANGQTLETEQFFWDTKKAIVYSEKHTKITEPNGTIATGNSFIANQDFTNMRLIKGRATIIVTDEDNEDDDG